MHRGNRATDRKRRHRDRIASGTEGASALSPRGARGVREGSAARIAFQQEADPPVLCIGRRHSSPWNSIPTRSYHSVNVVSVFFWGGWGRRRRATSVCRSSRRTARTAATATTTTATRWSRSRRRSSSGSGVRLVRRETSRVDLASPHRRVSPSHAHAPAAPAREARGGGPPGTRTGGGGGAYDDEEAH